VTRSRFAGLLLGVAVGVAALSAAAQDASPSESGTAAPEAVVIRHPPQAVVSDFLADSRFDYGEDVRSGESLFARLVREFFSMLARIQDATGPMWEIFVWILLGCIVVFTTLRLLKGDFSGAVYDTGRSGRVAGTVAAGTAIDYAEQLRAAEQDGDLRGALRWRYLLLLERLDELGMISWRREKTNLMYTNEIKDPGVRSAFREITSWYERSWYGAWTLPEPDYHRLMEKFDVAVAGTQQPSAESR
jgi:hypothetical protein